jgi:hypothetical protein
MARQIRPQAKFEGERISNDDLAKLEQFYVTNVVSIDTNYGPSYVVSISANDGKQYYTFMAPGIKQRDEMYDMFAEDNERIGPLTLDKLPTKQGRSVWMFVPVLEGDDLPF